MTEKFLDDALFRATGAVFFPGYAAKYLETLSAEFEKIVPPTLSDGRRQFIRAALVNIPSFQSLVTESDIAKIIERILSREVIPVCGDATRYIGTTYWHTDVQDWKLPMIKFAIYLDSDDRMDEFAFLPCSQHFPPEYRMPEKIGKLLDGWSGPDSPARQFSFGSGDAVMFNPRLAHAVLSPRPRRQLSIIFAAKPRTVEEKSDFQQLLMMNALIL